ncbi:MAG: bactofilin family protein, partial [Candidatus Dormibacteraceae bacterium]
MNCFPELTYSVYLDRELPAEESRAVESHLAACAACRARVELLRMENKFITEALNVADEAVAGTGVKERGALPLAWALPVMMGGIIALSWTIQWLSNTLPVSANWLNPFNRTAILNYFLSFAFYLSSQREAILHWFGLAVTTVAVGLLVAGGIYLLIRHWPLHLALLGTALVLSSLGKPAYAMEARAGGTVTVPPGQTLNDSLAASAQSIEIGGKVNGNLIAHAQRITISGTVTGDVIIFAQTLDIDGTVQGNVFAWAQFVTVRGKVGQSVHVFAESMALENGADVDGDILAFCQSAIVNGNVGGGVAAWAGSVMVHGTVNRSVYASARQVTMGSSARVGDNLVAKVHRTKDFRIEPGAVVAGKTEVRLTGSRVNRFLTVHFYLWRAVELCAVWLTGLVFFWLFPSLFKGKMDNSADLLKAVGWGFVVLVATPIAALIVALTLVGLPIAILAIALWLVGM